MAILLSGSPVIRRRECEDCFTVEAVSLIDALKNPHFCKRCLDILEAIEETGEEV